MRVPARIVPALLCTVLPAQEAALPFDAPQLVFPPSVSITSVGDLDNDGDVDALGWYWQYYGYFTTANVSTFLNNGNGIFQRGNIFALWVNGGVTSSWDTEIGQFDQDPMRDFVVVFHTAVNTYLGNANTGIVPHVSWNEPWAVRDTVLADFDADGRDDLALVGNEVRVYRNTGTGFALAATWPLAGAQLFRGDFDGDARPDLMVPGTGNVTLLRCDGSTIQPIATVTHGVQPGEEPMIVVGDVDNDSDTDIVVFNDTGQYVTLRCSASGTFVPESRANGGPATGLADIDGDGDLDGVCRGGGGPSPAANTIASTYHIAENLGGGVFAPAFTMKGLGAFRLAGAVDVDGDGDRDLVGGRTIWFNRGDIFGVDPQPDLGTIQPRSYEPFSDVDRDGDPDLVPGYGVVWRNDGSGTYVRTTPLGPVPPPGTSFRGPGYRGDFDGDGDEDVIVGHVGGQTYLGMRLLRNNGGGGYVDGGPALPAGVAFTNVAGLYVFGELALVADLDSDGDLDIAQGHDLGLIQIVPWLNNGSGFFTRGTPFFATPPLAAADLDGDGNTDLVANAVFFGNGAGGFVSGSPNLGNIDTDADRIAIADLDGDGLRDIVYYEHDFLRGVYAWWNNGNRTFTAQNLWMFSTSSFSPRSVDVADFDGDGFADVMAWPGNWTDGDAAMILFGDAQGRTFTRTVAQVIDPRGLADVDGDSDLDVLGPTIVRGARAQVPADGLRRQYGSAVAGSGGMAPTLGASGPFHAGATVTIRATGLLGGSFAVLGLGTGPGPVVDWPLPGLTGHAHPLAAIVGAFLSGTAGTPGAGAGLLPVPVPAAFAGGEVYLQGWGWDPAAASGVVQTNGLFLHFR